MRPTSSPFSRISCRDVGSFTAGTLSSCRVLSSSEPPVVSVARQTSPVAPPRPSVVLSPTLGGSIDCRHVTRGTGSARKNTYSVNPYRRYAEKPSPTATPERRHRESIVYSNKLRREREKKHKKTQNRNESTRKTLPLIKKATRTAFSSLRLLVGAGDPLDCSSSTCKRVYRSYCSGGICAEEMAAPGEARSVSVRKATLSPT